MESSTKKIWGISIFNGMTKMLTMSVMFFWAIFYNSVGLSGAQIGMIFATSSITGLISVLPSGFINDKIKSRNLISFALLMLATQFIGISFFDNFTAIISFAFIGGIGNYLYIISSESIFYKSAGEQNKTKEIAIFQSILYFLMGTSIASSGYMMSLDIPFQKIILGGGVFFIILSAIAQLLPKSAIGNSTFVEYKKDILDKKVLLLLAFAFLFSMHYGSENTSYGLFLKETLGLNQSLVGLYMGSAIFIMGIFSIIAANSLKKIDSKYLLFISLLLSGIGQILMTNSTPIISYIFRVIHEIGDAGMFVFLAHGILSFFKSERIGGNNGILNFVIIIGSALSNIISGPIGEKFGYDTSLIIGGIMVLAALVVGMVSKKIISE